MSIWSTSLARLWSRVRSGLGARMARVLARVALAVLLVLLAVSGAVLGLRRVAAADDGTPHVWLHYDYVAPDPEGNSFAPNPDAIQLVVDAYARHGIKLEIDNQHNEIPYQEFIDIGHSRTDSCTDASGHPFSGGILGVLDARAQYFQPTSNHEWHYVLFGDQIDPCDGYHLSGEAELPGDNFVIAMRYITYFYRYGLDWGNRTVGGSFMHELGHNLGLRHGGGDDNNYKPNYLSVMNYDFIQGIPYGATPGSSTIVGARLDYSDEALPTLDTAHLDETVGVGGGPTDTDITKWFTFDVPSASSPAGLGPTSGPLDWNLDGSAVDRDVQVAVDCTVCFGLPLPLPAYYYHQLTGFDDWAAILAYLAGTRDPGPKTIETDGESQEPIVTSISPDGGSANGGTVVTITGTHLDKATEIMFGSVGSAPFTIVNDKTIKAIAPVLPKALPTWGSSSYTTDVTVISDNTPSPSVDGDLFTYTWPAPAPTITSVSPSNGPFAGGTTILIKGSGLYGTTAVSFYIPTDLGAGV